MMMIELMMKAVRTSETSVYFNKTARWYIPECCNLHTRRSETLKSQSSASISQSLSLKCKGKRPVPRGTVFGVEESE
jgi:hypothetical protein